MNEQQLKNIIEAALLAAGQPLTIDQMLSLFEKDELPKREDVRAVIKQLQEDYVERALELTEVSSGFRLQVKEGFSRWVSRLWSERPSRYSRALLETLALVAYRQPITRGEIEDIRGVSVSSSIMKTLLEREWVRVVGHRDVPGKPAMYGSTKKFLDYFNLKNLDELPTLAELRDLSSIANELGLEIPGIEVEGQQQDSQEVAQVEEGQIEEDQVIQEEETLEKEGDAESSAETQREDSIDEASETIPVSTLEPTLETGTAHGRLSVIEKENADEEEEDIESEAQYATEG